MLSNLLQELTLAKDSNRKHIVLDEARLNENPVERLSRLIRYSFWPNLTRRIDASSIEKAGRDPKDWTDDPYVFSESIFPLPSLTMSPETCLGSIHSSEVFQGSLYVSPPLPPPIKQD